MLIVKSINLMKTAALPENIQQLLHQGLTPKEEKIFGYLREACEAVPYLSGGQYSVPTARLIGGWVRDKLMMFARPDVPVKPPDDLDISMDIMDGATFAQFLLQFDQSRNQGVFSLGMSRGATENRLAISFGRIWGDEVEFGQLRKEEYGTEGDRHSVVTQVGTPKEDAYRRDLTVNAMSYNINTQVVEDLTGQGYDDLMSLTLRAPIRPGHDVEEEIFRIFGHEDPIRVLRVLRFYSRWPGARITDEVLRGLANPKIQELVLRKMHDHSLDKDDPGSPPEKVAKEFRKMMMGQQPHESIKIMHRVGLLPKMLGIPKEWYNQIEESQLNPHHELTFLDHTMGVLQRSNELAQKEQLPDQQRGMLNTAALFHDFGKLEPTHQKWKEEGTHRMYPGHEEHSSTIWKSFADALKLSIDETDFVGDLVGSHMEPHKLVDTSTGEIKADNASVAEFVGENPRWKYILMLSEADSMSKGQDTDPRIGDLYRTIRQDIAPKLLGLTENVNRDPLARGYQKEWADSDLVFLSLLKPGEIISLIGLDPKKFGNAYITEIEQKIRQMQYSNFGSDEAMPTQQARQLAINIVEQMRQGIWMKYGPKPFGGNPGQYIMAMDEYAQLGPGRHIGVIAQHVQQLLQRNPDMSIPEQIEAARALAPSINTEFGQQSV